MLTIRDFVATDIAAVTAIYAEAVQNGTGSYEIEPPSLAEMQRRFTAFQSDGFPVLIAEEAGEVVGYAYVNYFRTRPAYRWMVEDSIYVAPKAKGRSVGKALLRTLIERAEALGFRQMLAVIGDGDNNIASVRLHASLGFRQCGRIEGSGFKHGRWLDTVLMQLPLNGGKASAPSSLPPA
ncbi:GNAT family N-acetyltransferase [Daeguia caeni]|uniref:GNAT family N-acetyltransferase n=1 Tax=Daeguia caeni TaxID=439612 RepID=A0ABV9HB94_9HYPH